VYKKQIKSKFTAAHRSHDLFVDIDNIYFLQQNVSVRITFQLTLRQIPRAQSEDCLALAMQTKSEEILSCDPRPINLHSTKLSSK